MRMWRTAIAVVCVGSTVGFGTRAGADDGWRRVRIEGGIESDNPTATPFSCDAAGHCVVGLSSVNTYTGGLAGSSASRSSVAFDQASGLASITGFELITGHVAGCGDGSFTALGAITRLLQSPGTGSVEVVAGSGSGDLVGLSGRGSFSVTPTGPTSATSTFSLVLRCRHR